MTTELESARATKADLEAKRVAVEEKRRACADERTRIAFDAHTGGPAARKRLDEINATMAKLYGEAETLDAAIAEASRRVADAEAKAERAELAARADRALEIGVRLAERARRIDTALAIVAEEATAYKAGLDELNRLGATHPNAGQFMSLGTRALSAAMMQTPLKIEHLAPHERRTFSQIAEGQVAMIERWAEPRLAAPKAEAA